MVYSIIIGSEMERSRPSVIVALDPELSCLGSQETTAGSSLAVYSIIIGLEPERLRLSVIAVLELELLCLGSWDVELSLLRCFGDPDLGFLWRGLKGIVYGGSDGFSYVGIGVTLG